MTLLLRIRLALPLVLLAGLSLVPSPVRAAGAEFEAVKPPAHAWSFEGIFGTFDRAAAQRGLQVYREVCASCHGLKYVAYRNLMELGYTEDQVKAFAKEFKVQDGPNDDGEMFEREARPADRFVSPFPNEKAARAANNGAYPPDLSLIVDARADGANYVKALLIGYEDPPANVKLNDGMYYNKYFSGHQIGMPKVINEDGVTYADGTKATEAQMAADVVQFLTWAAEPNLEERKRMGVKVMLFLTVFTVLMYLIKRKVWADVSH